jgi:BirA family transcriptional regulator, biotin operon repressor / biotin---[acetyl-CoA-carboxylase] ligase
MKKGHAYLLSIISDGNVHSGQELADQLGISRAAIWKSIKYLQSLGLKIDAIRGKGYCLDREIDLLSSQQIKKMMTSSIKKHCREIEILFNTESTNSYLWNCLNTEQIYGKVVLAEYQSKGRGRRGNQWVSPVASGIYLSIGWRLEIATGTLGLLSLCIGVAVARALCAINLSKVGLKWPNDIIVDNKKLGGILLEMRGEASGPVDIVIGIGINYELPESARLNIDQDVTDICSNTTQRLSRNKITAIILSNVIEILVELESSANSTLIDEWRKFDCYVNKKARLLIGDKEIEGVLKGVDNQGALLMSVNGKIETYMSGEVSLRVV